MGFITAYYLPNARRFFYYFAGIFSFLLLFILFYFKDQTIKNKKILLFLFIYIFAILYFHFYCLRLQKDFTIYDGKEVEIIGYVKDFPQLENEKVIYEINTFYIKDDDTFKKLKSTVKLTTYESEKIFEYGDVLRFKGKIKLSKGKTNPGNLDFKALMLQKGITAAVFSREIDKIGEYNGGFLKTSFYKVAFIIKKHYENNFEKYLDLNFSSLLISIIFGVKENLPSAILEEFSRGGIMHVLAASGMNVGIIYVSFYYFLDLLNIERKIISLFIVFLYTIISNFSPPVIRAFIMLFVVVFGELIGRKSDPLNSLSFSAFILLILNPLILFSISFQFSFLATLGLVLFYGSLTKTFGFLPKFLNTTISSTIAAQIILLPFLSYYFHFISLIGVLTNIIVVPIISLCLVLGLIAGIGILPFLTSILLQMCKLFLNLALIINRFAINMPFSILYIPERGIFPFILYYIIVAILFNLPEKAMKKLNFSYESYYKKLKIPIVAFCLCLIFIIYLNKNPFEVTFLDVGQGDCAVITTQDNKVFIIDGGGIPPYIKGDFDTGKDIIDPFLKSKGIKKIEAVIISHFDDDHARGLLYILKNYEVKYLIYGRESATVLYREILDAVKEKNVKIIKLNGRDNFGYKDLKFEVLNPIKGQNYGDENDASLVIKMDYKGLKILFTGDLGKEGEKLLLQQKEDLKAHVLKVGHHGSKTSSSEEFIDAVSPYYAVISVGKYNNFGHPSPEVLELLKNKKITILRTDEKGAISFKIEKGNVIYKDSNGKLIYYNSFNHKL
ncbi:MAG: DNA internalization-related competence protein ComEC/Rec2 [Thermovenabulum sp.]|uniref:DNA internalization-related competence protein ComEC/Rec2 n=1 Tax=Thermovenabulum sp. TaxID=3100335 RepID=UPI003C7C876D